MSFNIDPSKQAQEVIFPKKLQNLNHDSINFDNNLVQQNHLGIHLDTKLNFQEHFDNIMSKVDKSVGLLRKLPPVLPRPYLVTICKAFTRPHLDYGDIIYDQT